MINYEDEQYKYRVSFNPITGVYVRTSVLDDNKLQTEVEAFRGSYPHLLDVGIMGHCLHGISGKCAQSGVQCYQSGSHIKEPHMSYDNFKKLIDESSGKTFQIALGGRGDPDQHPDFINMIRYARENNIVPNFTTSGYGLDFSILPEVKKYCGAVAVSYYRSFYTTRTIHALLAHGIKTNIHYVLSNDTIDEAIDWIENKKIPSGINRVIFLLHKPVGNGSVENVLSIYDPKVKYFYNLFNKEENCNIAGFDTCTAPALIHFAPRILKDSYDTCEGGRFSAYVTPDFKLLPCSFDGDQKFAIRLDKYSVEEAFNSTSFDNFRDSFKTYAGNSDENSCRNCVDKELCLGGCPIMKSIVICDVLDKNAL
ncbi:SPASM domain-containing protein [Fusibacter bizertensis]|uniref:SPASM domain-containing protein n=1 Tax=Fusibacter bizertensis TaxID=1488331 RepID=A0ABT6NEB3_9FIRM|nr:SPASM domain-containing protein [Fusibacter bizertensis]MDH8678769.1 SPASM domain-containing protein [Fusibacter bizertensis]